MKRKDNEDAAIQRRRVMSQDERNFTARDELTGRIKEHAEKMGDTTMTHEKAQQKANEIAHKVDRDSGR